MSVDSASVSRSGRTLADAARLLEWTEHAFHPESSGLGRVVAVIFVVRLGARLIPVGRRVLRQHPVASVLLGAGLLGALYLVLAPRSSPRPRFG